jgi:type IX secretion system PorP/SprF family membrane protein
MYRLFIIFLILTSVRPASSQRIFPVHSQYMLNGLALNPAYAGSRDVFNITLGYRNQWVGFDGAPVSQTLSAHSPMRNEKIALGVLLGNEQIDVRNNTSLLFNYAYRMRIGKGRLALGLKGGAMVRNVNWTRLSFHDEGDDVFNNPGSRHILPEIGFGVYYHSDRYFFGVSIPGFLSDSINNGKSTVFHDTGNYNYLVTGGFVAGNRNVKVKPSFLLKYNEKSPVQVDANLSLILADLIWIGASYRIENTFVALFKLQVNEQLRLGYTYDYSLGPIGNYNKGSHEIVLIYDFRYRLNAVNPRYF